MNIPNFHTKRDWEFWHHGKHEESLCKKIQRLADAVDFQHAKHEFFSAVLHVQDTVKERCDHILHKKESLWSRIMRSLKKRRKSRKRHARVVHIKREIHRTKGRVFEIMHMDEIIDHAIDLAKKKRVIKEAAERTYDKTLRIAHEQVVEPVKDVCNVPALTGALSRVGRRISISWYKFKVMLHNISDESARGARVALRPTLSALHIMAVFAIIFTATFVTLNIEAFTTVSTHYLKNDTFFKETLVGEYLNQKDAAKEYIQTEVLTPPPEDLVLAEEERERNEEDRLVLPPLDLEVTPDENRLYIPRIDKNIPIQNVKNEKVVYGDRPQDIEDAIQEALKEGVVHYPGTAKPGEQGNVALTGHSSYYLLAPGKYKDVFALLHTVELDDEIIVYYGDKQGDQEKHVYKVTDIKEVKPHEVDILKQTDDYRLTLITCTPIGTTLRRLVVTAIQVE